MPAVMKVFAGPPGTGKTWHAAREAVRTLIPEVDERRIMEEHQRLVNEGRILWVTFHPAFSYEDFVEGFRPEETETGAISYSVVPGPFLRACEAASSSVSANRFHIGQKIGKYEVTHVDSSGVVLKGSTTRSDAVSDSGSQFVDFWTLRLFEQNGLPVGDMRLGGDKYERRKEVCRLTGVPTTFFGNSSRHAAVYQYLRDEATKTSRRDVVLVIDEMNRADLSRVFGELITLLEFDKRQGEREARQVLLTYSHRPFSVPAELSIIGTMNTADKSLSAVDLALRRRFEFVLIPPDPTLAPAEYAGLNVQSLLKEMNNRLTFLSGPDNLLGHADFIEAQLEALRVRERFEETSAGKLKVLAHILRTKTIPMLIDLFRGDMLRVRAVAGRALFEEIKLQGELAADMEEFVSEAAGIWQMARWWNPSDPSWSADRFRAALEKHQVPRVGVSTAGEAA